MQAQEEVDLESDDDQEVYYDAEGEISKNHESAQNYEYENFRPSNTPADVFIRDRGGNSVLNNPSLK
ncbi:MAG: hypothetical protein MRQ07_05045 [Candidatus Midichloria sp.]|nr:hypothetical protein [Candidatus Midichloria sp.]